MSCKFLIGKFLHFKVSNGKVPHLCDFIASCGTLVCEGYSMHSLCLLVWQCNATGCFTILSDFKNLVKQKVNEIKSKFQSSSVGNMLLAILL